MLTQWDTAVHVMITQQHTLLLLSPGPMILYTTGDTSWACTCLLGTLTKYVAVHKLRLLLLPVVNSFKMTVLLFSWIFCSLFVLCLSLSADFSVVVKLTESDRFLD